jgi:hypothetical protein
MITVVKVNPAHNNFDIYIGREWAGIPQSPFHNPFHIGKDGDRKEVLLIFAVYWYAPEQKWLRDLALARVRDNEILGCWCKPLDCHGDLVVGYVNWKRQNQESLF